MLVAMDTLNSTNQMVQGRPKTICDGVSQFDLIYNRLGGYVRKTWGLSLLFTTKDIYPDVLAQDFHDFVTASLFGIPQQQIMKDFLGANTRNFMTLVQE